MAVHGNSDFLASFMPKSPGEKHNVVMVRIINVCVCSVLAGGVGKYFVKSYALELLCRC